MTFATFPVFIYIQVQADMTPHPAALMTDAKFKRSTSPSILPFQIDWTLSASSPSKDPHTHVKGSLQHGKLPPVSRRWGVLHHNGFQIMSDEQMILRSLTAVLSKHHDVTLTSGKFLSEDILWVSFQDISSEWKGYMFRSHFS